MTSGRGRAAGRALAGRAAVLGAAALAVAGMLCGCVFSSTITEVIYEQDEGYEIDYSAPKKYVNSVEGDVKSDELASLAAVLDGTLDVSDTPDFEGELSEEEVEQANLAAEGALASQESAPGANTRDGAGAGGRHDESVVDQPEATAGNERSNAAARKPYALEDASRNKPNNDGPPADDGEFDPAATGSAPRGAGQVPGGTDAGAPGGGGRADGEENAGSGEDPNANSNAGSSPGAAFYETGAYDDLPTGIHAVAAVGNAAIVAAALGGADGDANLVAADAALMASQAPAVMAARGLGSARVCWDGDGTVAGSAHIGALLELPPDAAVLVSEGDDTLTPAEREQLESAGISVVFVPAMTSPERVKACVMRIGALLGRGGDVAAGDLAQAYEAFHDGVQSACADAASDFTLYVSEWRDGAYSGPYRDEVNVTGGAFAPGGAAAQPLSAYTALAGVVNVTSVNPHYAALHTLAIVWPLAGGTRDDEWSGISNVNGGIATTGSGFDQSLTRYTRNAEVFDMGTPSYSAFICKTGALARRIEADRASGAGLYSAGHGRTSIASDGYGIYVNPHGLFSSWADGSMESVLEAAWVHKMFKADDGYFEQKLGEFYDTFYGYGLTDASAILDAVYAE